ncbi:hypothetical protein L332_08445 [Agrococcus pavilionensis RW1]|uniref:RES domain-containing protein n=1 Tax=Agrococcus pavilionensis RW1 TaxID=1330458 RepID=U1LBI3_9MICO|nr:hypothetical protein L332_08445 [Agrococcus pavilionensis RW1]
MSAKNPTRPPGPLALAPGDVRRYRDALFRIHATAGAHPSRWDELREFGPLSVMRWDPQPLPQGMHAGRGVAYTGTDVTTAFAEVFQSRRAIRLTAGRTLSGWLPSRELELLDLTGLWPVRQGASGSLHAAAKSTCRTWAAAIHDQLGERIDGLQVLSTMTSRPMVVLFGRAADAFPAAPEFSRPLAHAAVQMLAVDAADSLGWPVV